MRFVLLIVMALFAGCATHYRGDSPELPAEVRGVLNGRTVLSGHVIVAGDILVPVGSRLVIRPGTSLLIRNSESTKIDPEYLSSATEILVQGSLVVDGRADQSVTFRPETPVVAGETAWAGIIFDSAGASVVRHAAMTQAETSVHIVNSSPEVTGNRMEQSRYGIIVQGGESKILDNTIVNGEAGIFCWNGAKPYLMGNRILNNDEEGIVVDRSSMPYVDRNVVTGNGIGLVVPENVPYDPVKISGNDEDIRILAVRRGAGR